MLNSAVLNLTATLCVPAGRSDLTDSQATCNGSVPVE
jgi:hypothetical protein